jgi:CubicO group peptidase (beta-lactamase class C family)
MGAGYASLSRRSCPNSGCPSHAAPCYVTTSPLWSPPSCPLQLLPVNNRPARLATRACGAYMARGVHGQGIYIDPKAEMVIARYASHPAAGNAANDPVTLPAYMALAKELMAGG